jgi:hypothetical protein
LLNCCRKMYSYWSVMNREIYVRSSFVHGWRWSKLRERLTAAANQLDLELRIEYHYKALFRQGIFFVVSGEYAPMMQFIKEVEGSEPP